MKKKFITKNRENKKKLDKFIDENKDDIRMMIGSADIFEWIRICYDHTDYQEANYWSEEPEYRYRGIRMKRDVYSPASSIYFVRKSERIDFNVPCICGIFQDEPHP